MELTKEWKVYQYLMLVLIVILIFLGEYHFLWPMIDVVFLYSIYLFVKSKDGFLKTAYLSLSVFLVVPLLVLYVVNICVNDATEVGVLRMYYNTRFVVICFPLIYLAYFHQAYLRKILRSVYVIGCIQFFINFFLIYRQYKIDPGNIDEHNGMFGYGSSHSAGMFWLFLINYGFILADKKLLLGVLVPLSVFLASITDNKFFYIGLILSFALNLFMSRSNLKYFIRVLLVLIVLLVIFYLLYMFYAPFREFTENVLIRTYYLYFTDQNKEKSERSYMLAYALSKQPSYAFGAGAGIISSILMFTGKHYEIIKHLDMHEITIQVYENGIVYTFLLCLLYARVFSLFWIRQNFWLIVIFFLLIGGVFYYGRFITDPRLIFYFILSISCIGIKYNEKFLAGFEPVLGESVLAVEQ